MFYDFGHGHFDLFEHLIWWLHSLKPPQTVNYYVFLFLQFNKWSRLYKKNIELYISLQDDTQLIKYEEIKTTIRNHFQRLYIEDEEASLSSQRTFLENIPHLIIEQCRFD